MGKGVQKRQLVGNEKRVLKKMLLSNRYSLSFLNHLIEIIIAHILQCHDNDEMEEELEIKLPTFTGS